MTDIVERLDRYATTRSKYLNQNHRAAMAIASAMLRKMERQLKECAEVMACNDPGNYQDIFGDDK